jgi:hypothetical protein
MLATLARWGLLVFRGGEACVHQGSYAAMLALFVPLAAWCELASPWLLAAVAGRQGVSFPTTWAIPNATLPGPLNPAAVVLAIFAAAPLGMRVWR